MILVFDPINDDLSIKLLKAIYYNFKNNEKSKALETIKLWYDRDIDDRKRVVNKISVPEEDEDLIEMRKNSKALYVMRIPSVFVDDVELTGFYSINEIKYFLPEFEKMTIDSLYVNSEISL